MTKNEYDFYVEKGIVNGIGWEWGKSFSDLLRKDLQRLDEYNQKKWEILIQEVEIELAWPHDLAYWLWTSLWKKIKADFMFSVWVYRKLWWIKYKTVRITAFFAIFIGLLLKWNKYYNFKEKRILPIYKEWKK